ncbi:MAG: beta propeller repeat protein [Candidatus Dormibacteria bacterium]
MRTVRFGLPVLLALGLLMSACGATSGFSSEANAGSPASMGSAPDRGSGATGFQAVALTWVSPQQGWALGIAPGCLGQRCSTLLETTDGGRHWVTVADLHDCLLEAAPVGCPAGVPQVSQIRFANADIGYVFASDGGPFAMTTNGGLSWALQAGRQASAIKVGYGTALRVSFSQGGCPGPCDWSVDQAGLGQNRWTTIFTPPWRSITGMWPCSGRGRATSTRPSWATRRLVPGASGPSCTRPPTAG